MYKYKVHVTPTIKRFEADESSSTSTGILIRQLGSERTRDVRFLQAKSTVMNIHFLNIHLILMERGVLISL